MPSLKCIGGPHDGEIVKVDEGQREVVLRKAAPQMSSARLAAYGIGAVSATVRHTRYTRRRLDVGPDVHIEFLACEDHTSEDALRFALQP